MDGKFTENKSIDFETFEKIKEYPNNTFEIHLMSYNPCKYAKKIIELGITKVHIHPEVFLTPTELKKCISLLKKNKIIAYIVLNPTTSIDTIKPVVNEIDGVMLMSVNPGKEKQLFLKSVLEKVKEVRKKYPKLNIQLDGGINDKNAKEIFDAGANILSVGSFISSSENPKKALDSLKKIAEKN